MKNKLPDNLRTKQNMQRQESINIVLKGIKAIEHENLPVTIANLVEFTGLSRSLFAKPHIREILNEHENFKCKKQLTKPKKDNQIKIKL